MTDAVWLGTVKAMRFLKSDDDDDQTDASPSSGSKYDDSQVLERTLLVYGSIWLVIVIAFCWARRRFPKVYQLRKWLETEEDPSNSPTSFEHEQRQHGLLSWIREVHKFRDDQIMNQCGMDALCFIRIARMGYKLRYASSQTKLLFVGSVVSCKYVRVLLS